MKSSVYISSEKIEVIGYSGVGGGVSIEDYASAALPEGTMINGKITDSAHLAECLSSMRKEKPHLFSRPILTVDGNSILSKRITVPKLNRRLYDQMVREDFSDATDQQKETVCAWHMLKRPGSEPGELLACAADREQVESYISTFMDAGIRLKAIRIGVEAVLSYIRSRPDLQNQAFVLNILDGVMMLSMIFDHGANVFMSRTRLYKEDYDQFIQSVIQNLSGLIQFTKSEKFNDIEHSYYLGISAEDLAFMREVNPYPDIDLFMLDVFKDTKGAEKLPGEPYFSYLNCMLDKDSIDLIQSRKELDKHQKRQRPKKYWAPVFAAFAILAAIPILWLFIQLSDLNVGIKELNEYITNESVAIKVRELDELAEKTAYYDNVASQLEVKIQRENGMAKVSSQVMDLITTTLEEKVKIIQFSFDESTHILRVNGRSVSETDSAEYVNALRQSSLIGSVSYAGYSYNSESEYDFTIDVGLSSGEALK